VLIRPRPALQWIGFSQMRANQRLLESGSCREGSASMNISTLGVGL